MEENSILARPEETDSGVLQKKRRRWLSGTFSEDLPACALFDLDPVTDIPIRLAVEEGAIRNKRDLAVYKTTEEWGEFPKGTVLIAQLIEAGQPYALFVGDRRKLSALEKKLLSKSEGEERGGKPVATGGDGSANVRLNRSTRSRRRRRMRVERRSNPYRQFTRMSRNRMEWALRMERMEDRFENRFVRRRQRSR